MFTRRRSDGVAVLSVLLSLLPLGCKTRLLELDQPRICVAEVRGEIGQRVRDKIDILFVIDNSRSMEPMQGELRQRFGQFIQVFADRASRGLYADLHVGVTTSDYGAGASGARSCDPSPGGQRGLLQAVGEFAPAGCKAPVAARYLSFSFDAQGGRGNLPPGQSLAETFTCMAAVGAEGCGAEHVLEAAYAALRNKTPGSGNGGFLRDDALLAVVFLTNEDDCSAPADSDLFDDARAEYGFWNYRCTRYGITCGGKSLPYGSSGGPLAGCVSAPNLDGRGPGRLFDLSRYVDFFTRPASQGGVKADPQNVVLVAIAGPDQPFETLLVEPMNNDQPYVTCSTPQEDRPPYCAPTLQRSCRNPQKPAVFANPAVRLNAVVRAAAGHRTSSICDPSYGAALEGLAHQIVATLGHGCVPDRLPDPADPDCVVEDYVEDARGRRSYQPVPRCDRVNDARPCWHLGPKPACVGTAEDGLGVIVERAGAPTSDDSSTRVICAVLCAPPS